MRRLIFTHHALDRIREYKLTPDFACKAVSGGKQVKLGYNRETYKLQKYGKTDFIYKWAKGYIFTIRENPMQNTDILITVTRRPRKNLKFR